MLQLDVRRPRTVCESYVSMAQNVFSLHESSANLLGFVECVSCQDMDFAHDGQHLVRSILCELTVV